MVTEVKPMQPLKAQLQIDVTLFGMVTEVKLLQSLKASEPIDVTLLPMVTEVKLLQSLRICKCCYISHLCFKR